MPLTQLFKPSVANFKEPSKNPTENETQLLNAAEEDAKKFPHTDEIVLDSNGDLLFYNPKYLAHTIIAFNRAHTKYGCGIPNLPVLKDFQEKGVLISYEMTTAPAITMDFGPRVAEVEKAAKKAVKKSKSKEDVILNQFLQGNWKTCERIEQARQEFFDIYATECAATMCMDEKLKAKLQESAAKKLTQATALKEMDQFLNIVDNVTKGISTSQSIPDLCTRFLGIPSQLERSSESEDFDYTDESVDFDTSMNDAVFESMDDHENSEEFSTLQSGKRKTMLVEFTVPDIQAGYAHPHINIQAELMASYALNIASNTLSQLFALPAVLEDEDAEAFLPSLSAAADKAAKAANSSTPTDDCTSIDAAWTKLVLVDGKTLFDRLTEVYDSTQSKKPDYTQWFTENARIIGTQILAAGLMSGKAVEAYVPGEHGPEHFSLTHTGYAPTQDSDTMAYWRDFCNQWLPDSVSSFSSEDSTFPRQQVKTVTIGFPSPNTSDHSVRSYAVRAAEAPLKELFNKLPTEWAGIDQNALIMIDGKSVYDLLEAQYKTRTDFHHQYPTFETWNKGNGRQAGSMMVSVALMAGKEVSVSFPDVNGNLSKNPIQLKAAGLSLKDFDDQYQAEWNKLIAACGFQSSIASMAQNLANSAHFHDTIKSLDLNQLIKLNDLTLPTGNPSIQSTSAPQKPVNPQQSNRAPKLPRSSSAPPFCK